ncbi:MAG: L,D-transpeptidase [Niabella sp.]
MKPYLYFLVLLIIVVYGCNTNTHDASQNNTVLITDSITTKPDTVITPPHLKISYTLISKKDWQQLKDSLAESINYDIMNTVNRVDSIHLNRLDSILVPDNFALPLQDYLPFPNKIALLIPVEKILLFSYPAQVFAAYENGNLIRTGPTSMGRKSKQTPQRLYFTNWKAKTTTSTINSTWVLNWNFNIQNYMGIGFHEYALPGYPASHSCMRLLEKDAAFLYSWANQWMLKDDQIIAYGTPVIVFGEYPFGQTKPWNLLASHPDTLTLNENNLQPYIQPHLEEILQKQEQRTMVISSQ